MVGRQARAAWTRALALASLTLLPAAPAAAQAHFGFVVGPALSQPSGDAVSTAASQWGILLGLNFEYELSRDWQVEVGFALSQKGGDKVGIEGGSYDYRMDYLEVPITLSRMFWLNDGPWAVAPFAGVSIGMKTRCALRPAGDRAAEFEECTAETPGGDTPGTFYGVPFGLALRRRFPGGSALGFQTRYTVGLNQGSEVGEFMATQNTFSVLVSFVWAMDTRGHGTPSAPNPNR